MLFRLSIVILAILVLNSHAHRSSIRSLDKWDLYGNDLLTLVYKRYPTDQKHPTAPMDEGSRAGKGCSTGDVNTGCEVPGTARTPVDSVKRSRDKLDIIGLLRSLSRNEIPEYEIFESNDYDDKR